MLRTLSIPFFEKIRRVPSKRVFFLTRKIPPRIFFAKKEGILSVPSFYAQGVSFCYFCANFGIWNFESFLLLRARKDKILCPFEGRLVGTPLRRDTRKGYPFAIFVGTPLRRNTRKEYPFAIFVGTPFFLFF